MTEDALEHVPVLLTEAVEALRPRLNGVYVDATVGCGGHSEAILQSLGSGGLLIGIDRDPAALDRARERLRQAAARVVLLQANFRDLRSILQRAGVLEVDGVLFDVGFSSLQMDTGERGFSYRMDAPLDMRMDPSQGPSAADLVNRLSEVELAGLIARYGEERWARRIARAIITKRRRQPLFTTGELAAVVKEAIPAAARRSGPHPARRTFQALRIAVNQELDNLGSGLEQACQVLRPGARLVVISFHSLEDRLVKRFFQAKSGGCTCPPGLPVCTCSCKGELRVVTRRPVRPRPAEVARNPRARSARLRVAEKLGSNGTEV